jgi:hypothetical protein
LPLHCPFKPINAHLAKDRILYPGYSEEFPATLTNFSDFVTFHGFHGPWEAQIAIFTTQICISLRITMAGTERQRELRRRRHRTKKLGLLHKKSEKASKADKAVIAGKLRKLTPGAEQLIAAWKLS